ncbi:hypothetical protein Y1Q_0009541 [Alligator mississippiensis]|uniref:Uncharacterized protein n=1 Tax=Alligator mississippiensis TaxID=8496 RepID=A0A151NVA1_ALLMI|nr:hypothetical protein Y1Q_0009541 [Alligator mississippiensis]
MKYLAVIYTLSLASVCSEYQKDSGLLASDPYSIEVNGAFSFTSKGFGFFPCFVLCSGVLMRHCCESSFKVP